MSQFFPESIDAEYMERWLGGAKVDSLSPKTLFDIQSLLRHYADIIVPEKNPRVEFPTEANCGARASVGENVIIIPTGFLHEGKVDDTIAATIHELHHIKLSDKENQIWLSCFRFACKVMDSLFVENKEGTYDSLYDLVIGGGSISFDELMEPKTTSALCCRKVCDDLAF